MTAVQVVSSFNRHVVTLLGVFIRVHYDICKLTDGNMGALVIWVTTSKTVDTWNGYGFDVIVPERKEVRQ